METDSSIKRLLVLDEDNNVLVDFNWKDLMFNWVETVMSDGCVVVRVPTNIDTWVEAVVEYWEIKYLEHL